MTEEQNKKNMVKKLDSLGEDLKLYTRFQLIPVYAALIVSLANTKIDLSKGLDFPAITLIACSVSYLFILIQRFIFKKMGNKIFKTEFSNNIFEVMKYEEDEEEEYVNQKSHWCNDG